MSLLTGPLFTVLLFCGMSLYVQSSPITWELAKEPKNTVFDKELNQFFNSRCLILNVSCWPLKFPVPLTNHKIVI